MAELPAPKTGIMDISPYVAGKSKAGAAQKIIKLSSNESPLGASPLAMKAYVEAATALHRYPEGSASALREAIAQVYGLRAEHIVCGAGSDELIGLLMHAYAGAGDEILYSQHGFLMYKIYAQGFGVTPVTAPEKNLTTDIEALLGKVTPRTKIVFIANPNNPTGSYISGAALRSLRERLPSHILLVIDAAYAEYASQEDYSAGQELVEETENTVMLRTFSKIYGLAAMRLGWGYFPAHVADVLNRIRGPFNVSAPAAAAGAEAVKDVEFTEAARLHNDKWLPWVSRELTALGLHVYSSIANFILVKFDGGNGKTAAAANQHLMEKGIIPREVGAYGLPDCLRITIGREDENKALVAALKDFLQK